MIKRILSIKDFQDRNASGDTYSIIDGSLVLNSGIPYNTITGITTGGTVEYYTGQTSSEAYIAKIPILLEQTIDDIGYYSPSLDEWVPNTLYSSGNTVSYLNNTYKCISAHTSSYTFSPESWMLTPTEVTEYNITFTGDTKINQFRRYGKTDVDFDLFNPTWNSGFTQTIYTSNGLVKQITGVRDNTGETSTQKLYDYKIWATGDTGTTLNYSDISTKESIITYKVSGLTSNNSIEASGIKLDYLIGVIEEPKINVDVFIDRGSNSSFDRHLRLGDIKSLNDLESYGNGYYKIKEE